MFFSHTIKAQPENMQLLDAIRTKGIRLFDYECITQKGVRTYSLLLCTAKHKPCVLNCTR